MNLDIYLDDFTQYLMQAEADSLARFCASAPLQRHMIPLHGFLLKSFAVEQQQDWPTGPLAALAQEIDSQSEYFFLAHLVHLDLRTDYFSLQALPDVSTEHSDAVIDSLNMHFQDRGLHFAPTSVPNVMLMSSSSLPLIHTHHIAQVWGKDVRAYLPDGEDALHWRMMLNEMQMLLHEHPVNAQREENRQQPINSVWIEGGGRLPNRSMRQNTVLMSQQDVVRGLARLSACEHLDLVHSFADLEYHDHLVIFMQAHKQIEQLWFEPLLEALRGATVKKLNLHFAVAEYTFTLSLRPFDVWKVWRRKKPLLHYFSDFAHAN